MINLHPFVGIILIRFSGKSLICLSYSHLRDFI